MQQCILERKVMKSWWLDFQMRSNIRSKDVRETSWSLNFSKKYTKNIKLSIKQQTIVEMLTLRALAPRNNNHQMK